jgi:hypothetical protein
VREIRLPRHSIRLHLLQMPLKVTADPDRARFSRWMWRQEIEPIAGDGPVRHVTVYTLTPLGILNVLFGLTVRTEQIESPWF